MSVGACRDRPWRAAGGRGVSSDVGTAALRVAVFGVAVFGVARRGEP